MDIEPPDLHFLNAADGWLGLGNPAEAHAELDQISGRLQDHPEVIAMRWRILAEENEWENALAVARDLIRVAPENPDGWINQSYCLHELKRTREAWRFLLPMAHKFSTVSTIPYNLACYACQMGNLAEAESWLNKARAVAGNDEIARMALEDHDLQPLWPKLKGK